MIVYIVESPKDGPSTNDIDSKYKTHLESFSEYIKENPAYYGLEMASKKLGIKTSP